MSQPATIKPLTIAVIDDNRDACDTLALLLEVMGHSARAAYDARAGMQLVQTMQPDLAFFDLEMPHMDGCAALRTLRELAPHLKALFVCLTGQSSHTAKQACMDAGFHRFITKPLSCVELDALLDRARERRTALADEQH
jgi:CheY-like chemotaxis protein